MRSCVDNGAPDEQIVTQPESGRYLLGGSGQSDVTAATSHNLSARGGRGVLSHSQYNIDYPNITTDILT